MSYNYDKLRGKIKEICTTQEIFAKKIGLSATSLSYKLNNVLYFTQDEIIRAVEVLGIPKEDINIYFFTPKVEQNSTETNEERSES